MQPASPTIRACYEQAVRRLNDAGIDSAALDARLLMQQALACDHAALIGRERDTIDPAAQSVFEAMLVRRINHEPISQILGRRDFWKDSFLVTPDVLTPRPDSETLIEAALRHAPANGAVRTIVELGVGSGCLLLSLLREYTHATGYGIDRSEAAIRVARNNAATLGHASRSVFLVSDWMQALQIDCDMIITNPPYIALEQLATLAPDVRLYEPLLALSGGKDGLDAYRQILPAMRIALRPGGLAIVELGHGQQCDVSDIAGKAGFTVIDCHLDLGGIPRALVLGIAQ